MKKLIYILLCLPLITLAQKTHVPDNNFENYLEANGMGDGIALNDSVFTANISSVTNLNVVGKSIVELTGIENFSALDTLQCYSNQLTNLNVSNNTALSLLYCDDNQLTSLDASNNIYLKSLTFYDNELTSLDLSNNTNLEYLLCDRNQLTNINLTGCTSLKYLYCLENQLTNLNLTSCTSLQTLNCENNQIDSLDVSGITSLTSFDFMFNPLTSLDMSGCSGLINYMLQVDGYSWMGINLTNLQVSGCSGITDIMCPNNQLSSLDLTGCTSLQYLDCEMNQIDSLDLSGFTSLTSLSCMNNPLISLDVSGCSALTGPLDLYGSSGNLSNLQVSGCSGITDIMCQSHQLTSLDLTGCTSLQHLDCEMNQITSLNLTSCTSLQTLNCGINLITSLDLTGCTSLQSLNCMSNQINSIDVSNCSALTSLDCNFNSLNFLDLRNGNNSNFTLFNANGNINLSCIYVDDPVWSTANWTNIDAQTSFYGNLPNVNAGSDQIVCEGTSVSLSGGSGATSYIWDNGVADGVPFIPLNGTNIYTVIGTDGNGCSATDQVQINSLELNVFPVDTFICLGDTVTLFAEDNYSIKDTAYNGPSWHVCKAGSDISGDGSVTNPFETINYAISIAQSFDTVYVAAGTYYENVSIDKDLVFLGAGIQQTIIDAGNNGNGIYAQQNNNITVHIEEFTVTNGSTGIKINTGGPCCSSTVNATIKNCEVINNTGTGIYIVNDWGGTSFIENNIIRNNSGNGINVSNFSGIIYLNNNTIDNNSYGVNFSGGNNNLRNNIISNNLDYGVRGYSSTITYSSYNNIWGNTNGSWQYSPTSTVGDISLDPQFVSATDFNLNSTSPCIDTGDPDLDGDGNNYISDIDDQDPDGTRLDMGFVYYSQGPIVNLIDSIDVPDIMCGSKLWSTGETTSSIMVIPTQTTTYYVSVDFTNPTCTITDSVTVYVNTIPNVDLGSDTLNYCNTDSVLLDAGLGYSNYNWSTGVYTIASDCVPYSYTDGQNTSSIYAQESGYYFAMVTDSLGCSSTDSVFVSLLTPNILGDTSIFQGDTISLLALIDGVGFLLESYDTLVLTPSDNIQNVLDTISEGTIIMLDAGTYNENLVWPNTNHIILSSLYGPEQTILDGSSANQSVIYVGNGQIGVVIEQLTITGGYGSLATFNSNIFGGGILIDENVRAVIKNCLIVENALNNSNIYAGGIFISYSSEVYCINNTIADNNGEGLWWRSGEQSWCNPNFMGPEYGRDGGAINNIIHNNSSYGFYNQSGAYKNTFSIRNNNSSSWYGGYSSYTETGFNGNISEDPLFVNATGGNYQLSAGSSSLTAGENGAMLGYQGQFNLSNLVYHPENVIYTWSTGDATQQVSIIPNQSTTYNFSIQDGSNSCNESINVLVFPHIYDSICTGTTYNFNGDILTSAGIYYDSLTDINGQDSLIKLSLKEITPPNVTVSNDTNLCSQSANLQLSYNPQGGYWSGTDVDSSGMFNPQTLGINTLTYSYTAAYSCVITEQMNITVHDSTSITDAITACDSIVWIDGNTYSSSNNNATKMLNSIYGCDSLVYLDLIINNSTSVIDTKVVCDSLLWIDSNTYFLSNNSSSFLLSTTDGCDSLVNLDLIVNNSVTTYDQKVACDSLTWIDGNTYTNSNNSASFLLNTIHSCDSVVSLNLTVNYSTFSSDILNSCDSYTWIDGNTYTSSNNNATHTLVNSVGCDSIASLDLTIYNSSSFIDTHTACNSYSWIDGNTYTTSNNTASHILTNSVSCDSLVYLDLTINYSTSSIDNKTFCDTYTWIDGNTYTASNNTATHTLTNAAGCDSLVTLNLVINNSTSSSQTESACNSYTSASGSVYTASGVYYDTIANNVACDSIITYNITLLSTSSQIQDTICNGTYTLNGQSYNTQGTHTQTLSNSLGCDSVIYLDLIIQDNLNITYSATSQVLSSPPYNVQLQNNTANLSYHNFTWDFGDGNYLQDNSQTINHQYLSSGLYDVTLFAEYISTGCSDSLYNIEYIYCVYASEIEENENTIFIYPNPTDDIITIMSENTNILSIELYDLLGKLILESKTETISLKEFERGSYVLKVVNENKQSLFKVIKN